ncbi:pyridoxal 5'-phosphate synthase glutaminase subunit PdxT [Candidatus Woesearchaeota archaeon]|nr:pyridoxal 5'-phosphate synthase glutaminase subunit PdxT [Candidatus Woesearchaeota archaeon]
MSIGVLSLQGSVKEHLDIAERCGAKAVPVRYADELKGIDGLIIPGGESTTIGKILRRYGIDKAIKKRNMEGMPIYGTCAGAILLAKDIIGSKQPGLGLMDISIKRNDYGRQAESFEARLKVLGKPFNCIFIRAPAISSIGKGCEVLGKLKESPIIVKQGSLLASTFHPELTDNTLVHEYFIDMVKKAGKFLRNFQ